MSGFNWSVSLSQLLAGVVSCITQCCFARRIWILKTTPVMRKVVFCIVVFAVIQCASAVAYSALIHIENANAGPAAFAAPIIWLTGSFICDTLIAGSLLHILFEARSQTQMKTTATVLTKLIAVTIQTGFITAVVAGLQLISYLLRIILPFIAANDYWVMCSFLLGKLYANVLLATLNARTIPVHIVDNELNMGLEMTPRQGILFRAALPDINHPTAFGALVSAPEQYYGADGGPATTMKGYADV
ncbi:hypothetical protein PLICRDRAFT_702255 [Plicaturopsis crispa FD-325 SS-3]|uniref:DUF6534 domain-containing protein n=1 Tax=Plicaturopsis crispa FD-325 SS-3 TaxID=944288 RepID=A0A0C9SKM5_PLICR|nr:hypothetical protein PLICRDRAFT_702255 [Plicaturopsis crispa FD-325 SS-3]